MKKINNLIFDLGEVIINIDKNAVRNRMISRGITNFDEIYPELVKSGILNRFETGHISPESFRDALREIVKVEATDEEIDEDWNAMLLDIPRERIRFMTRLKSKYKLYLLSNTNAIHWKHYDQAFQDKYDYPSLSTFFTKAWYSYLMGVRKPDPEIFRIALDEEHLDPSETAFIDDLKENVDAAASVGIYPLHLKPGMEIMDLFDEELELKV